MSQAAYDEIGRGYAKTRRTDPRIFERILTAIGHARSVVNVGAGTGNYEPSDRSVVAVEPSVEMIRQRSAPAPVVRGDACALPFADDAFDAALAVLTIHHWPDAPGGLREMARVASDRVVIFTHDTAKLDDFWLTRDYFPYAIDFDDERFLTPDAVAGVLDVTSVEAVPVPSDCIDGFLAAYWSRPEAYLDERIRAGMSSFSMVPPEAVAEGIERLRADLGSGRWDERNGSLRFEAEHDFGYRLVVANA